MVIRVLRTIRNCLRLAIDQRRYHFTYSRAFYEQGYHDLLRDVGGDDLGAWEKRGYKDRLYRVCDWVDRTGPTVFTGRHLEVACMYGKTAFWLAERYPSLTIDAFDFSRRFVQQALAYNPFPERIAIREGDLTAIAHTDASFDSVTCIDVTEHLPDTVYHAGLREIARVTKPGGFLLVMQGNTVQVEHIHILPEEQLVADICAAGFHHIGTYGARATKHSTDFFHLFHRQTAALRDASIHTL